MSNTFSKDRRANWSFSKMFPNACHHCYPRVFHLTCLVGCSLGLLAAPRTADHRPSGFLSVWMEEGSDGDCFHLKLLSRESSLRLVPGCLQTDLTHLTPIVFPSDDEQQTCWDAVMEERMLQNLRIWFDPIWTQGPLFYSSGEVNSPFRAPCPCVCGPRSS